MINIVNKVSIPFDTSNVSKESSIISIISPTLKIMNYYDILISLN